MSMARRVFPSRLELNRPDGSSRDAPFANVTLTWFLYVSPVQSIPLRYQTGTPRHFHSSTTSGSAALISSRMRASISPRQSPSSSIRASIFSAGSVMPDLLDADGVACGITQGAVPRAPRLVGRLLHDVGATGLRPLEHGVEIGGGEHDAGVGAFGHHLGDDAPFVVGDAGVSGGRRQHDVHIRPARGADGDPAHGVASDVLAYLEPERVAVERQ